MLGVDFPDGKIITLNADFHRIAERGEADDFHFGAIKNTHFHQALVDCRSFAVNAFDAGALAGFELIKRNQSLPLLLSIRKVSCES